MCYYDIDDTGFYDEFGNPIDPSQMDECNKSSPFIIAAKKWLQANNL